MGFKEARSWLIAALLDGRYRHEDREDQALKNVLAAGEIDASFVVDLLKVCRGHQHSSAEYHQDSSINVHVFKPELGGKKWYIKAYQLEPDAMFISVHLSEHDG